MRLFFSFYVTGYLHNVIHQFDILLLDHSSLYFCLPRLSVHKRSVFKVYLFCKLPLRRKIAKIGRKTSVRLIVAFMASLSKKCGNLCSLLESLVFLLFILRNSRSWNYKIRSLRLDYYNISYLRISFILVATLLGNILILKKKIVGDQSVEMNIKIA